MNADLIHERIENAKLKAGRKDKIFFTGDADWLNKIGFIFPKFIQIVSIYTMNSFTNAFFGKP